MFWDWVYAMDSSASVWWEKASGMLWMKFADIARRHQVPMSAEIVRIFRATFLYDTTIFRLWAQLDMRDEFRCYQREAGKRARRRLRRAFWKRVEDGLAYGDYVEIEDMWAMGKHIIGRVQHYLDTPMPDFAAALGKLSYTVILFLRVAAFGITGYLVAEGLAALYGAVVGRRQTVWAFVEPFAGPGWLHVVVAAVALLLLRKVVLKLQERDVQ